MKKFWWIAVVTLVVAACGVNSIFGDSEMDGIIDVQTVSVNRSI